jgi:CRISPR/Cas system-associated endonuclease/helicase Cas3
MPQENWREMTLDFETYQERDDWIREHADIYTVVRYLGPRLGYERHETKTLAAAEALARRMATEAGKPYLIYAVAKQRDAFVCYYDQEGNRH